MYRFSDRLETFLFFFTKSLIVFQNCFISFYYYIAPTGGIVLQRNTLKGIFHDIFHDETRFFFMEIRKRRDDM